MSGFFSSNLKFLRESKKITKTELAKRLKVHQSTISRWENDEMGATIDNAVGISEVLGVPLPELLGKDLRFENAELPPNDCIDSKENTISDEELERRLKELNEREGVKILFDKEGELTEEELNQIVAHAMFIKEQHYKNKNS